MKNANYSSNSQYLSPWWRRGIVVILLLEFAVLLWITTGSYYRKLQPPVPEKVIDASGSLTIYRNRH